LYAEGARINGMRNTDSGSLVSACEKIRGYLRCLLHIGTVLSVYMWSKVRLHMYIIAAQYTRYT
jgi:hypothetical protein